MMISTLMMMMLRLMLMKDDDDEMMITTITEYHITYSNNYDNDDDDDDNGNALRTDATIALLLFREKQKISVDQFDSFGSSFIKSLNPYTLQRNLDLSD